MQTCLEMMVVQLTFVFKGLLIPSLELALWEGYTSDSASLKLSCSFKPGPAAFQAEKPRSLPGLDSG